LQLRLDPPFTDTDSMVDLREIRANRIGITFQDRFRRDPFRFVADGLLLVMLYRLTRPAGAATATKAGRMIDLSAAARTFVALRGEPWGNDDPATPRLAPRGR
jgi:hypothetical protein